MVLEIGALKSLERLAYGARWWLESPECSTQLVTVFKIYEDKPLVLFQWWERGKAHQHSTRGSLRDLRAVVVEEVTASRVDDETVINGQLLLPFFTRAFHRAPDPALPQERNIVLDEGVPGDLVERG